MNADILIEEEHSFRSVIDAFMKSIGVYKSELKLFRLKVIDLMFLFGIVTRDSLKEKRKKPYKNSPYGRFINYEFKNGKRKHVDSFILNECGTEKVKEILKNYVTENTLFKNELKDMKKAEKEVQKQVGASVLIHWLNMNFIDVKKTEGKFSFEFNKQYYTYYENTNLVVTNKKSEKPFWFIINSLTLPAADDIANLAAEIIQCHYELKFDGETNVWKPKNIEQKRKDDYLEDLEARLAELESKFNGLNFELKTEEKSFSPEDIKNEIRLMAQPLEKRPYLYSIEEYGEANSIHINDRLKACYDYLEKRNLIDAVNAPTWKYNFNEDSIDLLCRIDKRASAVYDVRHRFIEPRLLSGTLLKEKSDKEEEKRFKLPYGLERINYRNKVLYIVEGVFDACFIKNAIAITTCIMPKDMRKVIDVYRKAGFKIVHVPDNFRAGDKGGKAALKEYLKANNDIFHAGDLIFNWEPWPEQKDINDVAVKFNVNEINGKTILQHCWSMKDFDKIGKFVD